MFASDLNLFNVRCFHLPNALFAGEKPPEDRGLLIDVRHIARLLNVFSSPRLPHGGRRRNANLNGASRRVRLNGCFTKDEVHSIQ